VGRYLKDQISADDAVSVGLYSEYPDHALTFVREPHVVPLINWSCKPLLKRLLS